MQLLWTETDRNTEEDNDKRRPVPLLSAPTTDHRRFQRRCEWGPTRPNAAPPLLPRDESAPSWRVSNAPGAFGGWTRIFKIRFCTTSSDFLTLSPLGVLYLHVHGPGSPPNGPAPMAG